MNMAEIKTNYINGVKETLMDTFGFVDDEANKVIAGYGLLRRLEVAPDVQLHTDYKDVAADMQRKGFFSFAK